MLIVILIQLFLVFWLIRYLIRGDKGPREPILPVSYTILLGVFAVFVAGILNSLVLPFIGLPLPGEPTVNTALSTLIIGSLAIGIIEEVAKAVPMKRFVYDKGYFNEVSDGIIYFGIIGMVFGAIETVFYALSFGSEVGINRIITVPFMHAGFTAIVGYFVARQKVLGKPHWTMYFGLVLAILLHALYNFGLFYNQPWSLAVSIGLIFIVNFAIFFLYKRARRTDALHIPVPRPAGLA